MCQLREARHLQAKGAEFAQQSIVITHALPGRVEVLRWSEVTHRVVRRNLSDGR
jgi:hypothetical protein